MAGQKSKKIVLTEREREELRRTQFRIALAVSAAALFLGGVWWLSTNVGPKRTGDSPSPSAAVAKAEQERTNARIAELRASAAELKKSFLEVEQLRAPTAEEVAIIEQAYNAQQEAIRLMRSNVSLEDDNQLKALKSLRDKYVADPLYQESLANEQSGNEALRQGNITEALKAFRAAQALQKRINDDYSLSEYRSTVRMVSLSTKIADAAALPLYTLSKEAEDRAKSLLEEGKVQEAQTAFSEAIALIDQLRREHRSSAYADMSRQKRLESALSSVRAQIPFEKRQAARAAGDAAMALKNFEEAAAHFQVAVDAQTEINTRHANSSYASPAVLDELETLRQTALSQRILSDVANTVAEMDAALRERRVAAAVRLLDDVNQKMAQAEKNFRRARWSDEEVKLKTKFLDMIRADLPALQDRLWNWLRPLAEDKSLLMLDREVPQALYRDLMGVNPSRNIGPLFPVDSVTWAEANEFAQRAGWVLGLRVRLPTRAEFEKAVGDPKEFVMSKMTWNTQNSGGEVKPVAQSEPNMNGFYDLLGNVSEWLSESPVGDPMDAFIAGGSVRENPARLQTLDLAEKPKIERQRFCGFRIVVEMP